MYLAIYICAIVLVASLIVTCFVLHAKSDKKRKEDFKAQREKEEIALLPKLELPQEEPKQLEEPLEEFSLEDVDISDKNEVEKKQVVNHFDSNNTDFDAQKKIMNEKFETYEKFLRDSMESVDDLQIDDDDDDENELEAIMNFDFDSIKGKSKEEILEITKDLPKRVRKLILDDTLNEDDEEDED
ncbi:MAG: hypothetical protein ACI4R8_01480 [Candidatus Caccovivens sp.]